jgi:hypothetical protein
MAKNGNGRLQEHLLKLAEEADAVVATREGSVKRVLGGTDFASPKPLRAVGRHAGPLRRGQTATVVRNRPFVNSGLHAPGRGQQELDQCIIME